MDEDPQLRVVVPDRHPVGPQGFPCPLKHEGGLLAYVRSA